VSHFFFSAAHRVSPRDFIKRKAKKPYVKDTRHGSMGEVRSNDGLPCCSQHVSQRMLTRCTVVCLTGTATMPSFKKKNGYETLAWRCEARAASAGKRRAESMMR
jgi:hypothetical protein